MNIFRNISVTGNGNVTSSGDIKGNRIVINGKEYNVSGNNITIKNDKVFVDGKLVEEGLSGIVEVKFIGDLAKLDCGCSATISGNVTGKVDAGTSVTCGDVGGDVDAGTSVHCGKVSGSIDAGTSVTCR